MRVVVIGDIGVADEMIHIGDEAMFEAFTDRARERGIAVTGVSSVPAESAARYGIDTVAPVGFGSERAAAVQRMDGVIRTAAGEAGLLDADDPAHALIAAVRDSDGVAVAGGGNMSTLWPHHIFERATLGRLAAAFGKPLVVTGQTIGPALDDADGALVTALLSSARLVGLREPSSFALCAALGVAAPTQLTIDDASYLVDDGPADGDYVLVSLASHVADADKDAVVTAVAGLLDHLAATTGLPVRFLAHFGSLAPEVVRGDSVMHERVIAAMASPADVITPTTSVEAAQLARGAALVVSSRYHPVVFAVPAGVPTIGIPVDDYTEVKLRGALGNFEQGGVLPVAALLAGDGPALASELWEQRAATRATAARISEEKRAASTAWWNRVFEQY